MNKILLTANKRLANHLINKFTAEKKFAFITPKIYSINNWLSSLWQEQTDLSNKIYPQLIKSQSVQIIFEQILEKSANKLELLRKEASASLICEAWELLTSWQVSKESLIATAAHDEDFAHVISWFEQYQLFCDENNYIDYASMVNQLPNLIQTKICDEIELINFDNIPPQINSLIEHLMQLGINIKYSSLGQKCDDIKLVPSLDPIDELHKAANYAKQYHATSPQHNLAIVVPDLAARRNEVADIFARYFDLKNINMSAPWPINNYPMVRHMFLALKLFSQQLDYYHAIEILGSKYFGDYNVDEENRHALINELKKIIPSKVTLDKLCKLIHKSQITTDIYQNLEKLNKLKLVNNHKKSILAILKIMNWPGNIELSTSEQHLYSRTLQLLDEYSLFRNLLGKHSLNKAINILQRIATNTPFLPETSQANIHVLGLLEATGTPFDSIWVTSMQQDNWPMECQPNPYIPISIQQQYDFPRSSPNRELKLATSITETLCRSAHERVIFSYSQQNGAKVSNLLKHFDELEYKIEHKPKVAAKSIKLQKFIDDFGPKVDEFQKSYGTDLIKLQSLCPFRAFVRYRLGIAPMANPDNDLQLMVRGIIIHEVLQQFWLKYKESDQVDNSNISKDLSNVITSAIDKYFSYNLYKDIEAKIIYKLCEKWLQEDLKHPMQILELESTKKFRIDKLNINARIDRLDKLANDKLRLLDYKTGQASMNDWLNSRPNEPQLPIYACFLSENIEILGFAMVNHQATINQLEVREYLDQWQTTLINLAKEYINGLATVTPSSPKACNTCDYHSICRIREQICKS